MQVMTSMEVCTYLRAVFEAATAQDAVNLWQPGPAPAPLKRLQPKTKPSKAHRGGSQGKGHPKGSRGGRGGYRGESCGRAAVDEADEVVLLLLIRAYTTTHGSDWPKNNFFSSFGQIQFLLSC